MKFTVGIIYTFGPGTGPASLLPAIGAPAPGTAGMLDAGRVRLSTSTG